MRVATFGYKLAGMRRPDRFVVYPRAPGEREVTVQGDRTIARVNLDTGRGLLNWRGSQSKYFVHLSKALGAEEVVFPQGFVNAVREHLPDHGDEIGPGMRLA